MHSRGSRSLMVVFLGVALVFAGCAYTSMSEKEMMKESGAMKSDEGMKKDGEMMKDDKGMMNENKGAMEKK